MESDNLEKKDILKEEVKQESFQKPIQTTEKKRSGKIILINQSTVVIDESGKGLIFPRKDFQNAKVGDIVYF